MSKAPAHFAAAEAAAPSSNGRIELVALLASIAAVLAFGAAMFLSAHDARILLITFAGVAVCLLLWFVTERLGARLERVAFPALLVILGCCYSLFFPISTVPDEGYHFMHAYAYANTLIPGASLDEMRADDLEFLMDESLSGGSIDHGRLDASTVDDLRWDALVENFDLVADDASLVAFEDLKYDHNPSVDLPQVRAPAAAGILLARTLGLGTIPLFYLGRLTNLLCVALLIALAVNLAPIARTPMMATALLPITLQQISSYSYDGPLIGLSFLFFALAMRACLGEDRLSPQLAAGILVTGCLLAPGKVIYGALLVLVVLIPAERFPSKAMKVVFCLAAILLPIYLATSGRGDHIAALAEGIGMDRRWNTNLGAYEYGTFYSLSDFIADPPLLVLIMANSVRSSLGLYVGSAVGSLLGNMEASIALPALLWIPLVLVLIVSALRAGDDILVPTPAQRALLVLVAGAVIAGSMAAMLLGCTFQGEMVIKGVQGRYFLPVLPCLLLALRPSRPTLPDGTAFALVSLLSCSTFVVLEYIAMVIITT